MNPITFFLIFSNSAYTLSTYKSCGIHWCNVPSSFCKSNILDIKKPTCLTAVIHITVQASIRLMIKFLEQVGPVLFLICLKIHALT